MGHKRAQCLTGLEGQIGFQRALRGDADRKSLHYRSAEDERPLIKTINVEYTASATKFEPNVCGPKEVLVGGGLR